MSQRETITSACFARRVSSQLFRTAGERLCVMRQHVLSTHLASSSSLPEHPYPHPCSSLLIRLMIMMMIPLHTRGLLFCLFLLFWDPDYHLPTRRAEKRWHTCIHLLLTREACVLCILDSADHSSLQTLICSMSRSVSCNGARTEPLSRHHDQQWAHFSFDQTMCV